MIHFIYLHIHLNVLCDTLDLLTIGILVSIVCIVAVSVTGVMTYMKLDELIRELRIVNRLKEE